MWLTKKNLLNMQARKLRHILKNTGYYPNNNEGYIALGSPMCHNLISVDKATLRIRYALDTFNKGRESLRNEELRFIWDKLHELVASGEINPIIYGVDVIENPIPVYYIRDGKLIEAITDKIAWPNTDSEGYTIFENTHFDKKEDAIKYGIKDSGYGIENWLRIVSEGEKELQKAKEQLETEKKGLEYFKSLLNEIKVP